MNAILQLFLPTILQLLNTPTFQALLASILQHVIQQIASGVPPVAAAQQATGLVSAATALHLTGNPVADIAGLVANLQPHAGVAAAAPVASGPAFQLAQQPGFTS